MLTRLRRWLGLTGKKASDPTDGQHRAFQDADWHRVIGRFECFAGLSPAELQDLRNLTLAFLEDKRFSAAQGANLHDGDYLAIATLACLPILNLGIASLDDWVEVVVYPGEFLVHHSRGNAWGGVDDYQAALAGEAFDRGPLILALSAVYESGPDYSPVIHEIAHKLDMRNGPADGCPPLHRGMNRATWATVMEEAYGDFVAWVEAWEAAGAPMEPGPAVPEEMIPAFDPYGAEAPEEFFAVMSEYFFGAPWLLQGVYPAVYDQLAAFYRQNPVIRLPGPPTEGDILEDHGT